MNAKSGLCPEDCGYCSQSKVSDAEIPRYNLLSAEKLLAGARVAAEQQAKTYCIVISARGPNEREMRAITTIVPQIKAAVRPEDLRLPRPAHAGPGPAAQGLRRRSSESQPQHQRKLLRPDLLDAHLSGSRRHAQGRPRRRHGALLRRHHRHGRAATPTSCEMAFALRDLGVESIPVNFLNPIDGTPLAGIVGLEPAVSA